MNTQEEARELIAQQRERDKHLRQTVLMRSTAEETATSEELQEEARETMRQHRQQEDRRDEKVLRRSTDEVGLPTLHNSEQ